MSCSTLAQLPIPLFFPFFVETVGVSFAAAIGAPGRRVALHKGARQTTQNNKSQKPTHLPPPADAFAGQSMPARQSGVICLMASRFATLDCSIEVAAGVPWGFCSAKTAAPLAIATTATSKTIFALDTEHTPYVFCSTDPSLPNRNSNHSGMEGLLKGALPAGVAVISRGRRSNLHLQFIPSYGLSSRDRCMPRFQIGMRTLNPNCRA